MITLTPAQIAVLTWTVFGAVASGIVVHLLGDFGYILSTATGLIILSAAILYQAILSSDTTRSSEDYFGARSHLSADSTMQSLGSTWVMLGNVVVANMFLGQQFGLVTFWVIITWAWAFLLIAHRVPEIRDVLTAKDTLHSFLHKVYGSHNMRLVAALMTVSVGIGVFSVELTAGASLLIAVLPGPQAQYVVPLLILLVVVVMAIGAIVGGLKGVITSDSTFFPLIVVATLLLLTITILPIYWSADVATRSAAVWFPQRDSINLSVFLIGIFALQVPLLLGDFGTWQRVKATNRDETKKLTTLAAKQARWQSFLWGVPVVVGILIAAAPNIGKEKAGNLYESGAPLIEIVRTWIESDGIPPLLRGFLLTVVLVGLLAVMLTTANSYLMVAVEAWVHDFRPLDRVSHDDFDGAIPPDVQQARSLCILFALIACIPIVVIVMLRVRLLDVVLIVFAVQVALAPAAVLGLYFPEAARALNKTVILSTGAAFGLTIVFGLVVTYLPVGEWLGTYGAYFAPVIALGIPTIAVAIGLTLKQNLKSSGVFLVKLFIPYG